MTKKDSKKSARRLSSEKIPITKKAVNAAHRRLLKDLSTKKKGT